MFKVYNPLDEYRKEKKKKEIEKYLVDALYQASALSSFMPFEEIIKTLANSNYGILSNEFKITYNEIINGESVESALSRMTGRSESKLLEQAFNILIVGYKSGADISDTLREVAENLSRNFDMHHERVASLTIERFTLIAAVVFIVPLILGALISLISGLSTNAGILDFSNSKIAFDDIKVGNYLYLGINTLICSFFIAFQENKKEKTFIYLFVLLPVALLLFSFMQNIKIV